MKERWILFYDGACPLCMRTKSRLFTLMPKNIKLTAVDLNSSIAKNKGYLGAVTLETPERVYTSYHACIKLLSETKYKWVTHIFLRPLLIIVYHAISGNRKLLSRFI